MLTLYHYITIFKTNNPMSYFMADRAHTSLMQQQDQHLEQITQIAGHLKKQGHNIGQQLEQQHRYAQELGLEMDHTTEKLNAVQKKLGELLETTDAGQICTCVMMAALVVVFGLVLIIF